MQMRNALTHHVVDRDERAVSTKRSRYGGCDHLHHREQMGEQIGFDVGQRLNMNSRNDQHMAVENRAAVKKGDHPIVVPHLPRRSFPRRDGTERTCHGEQCDAVQTAGMYPQRLTPLPLGDWPADAVDQASSLLDSGGQPLNIFATLARHPKLMKRWLVFGNHVLAKSSLPARDRELLILRVGWRCNAPYEWAQHVGIGLRSDIDRSEIGAIAAGPDDPLWSAFDAALLRAADELHDQSRIGDATWEILAARYNDEQMIDVIFAVGQYHLVSMFLNSVGVDVETDELRAETTIMQHRLP